MSSVSINNIVLMGRLTADPELRRSKNNNAVGLRTKSWTIWLSCG